MKGMIACVGVLVFRIMKDDMTDAKRAKCGYSAVASHKLEAADVAEVAIVRYNAEHCRRLCQAFDIVNDPTVTFCRRGRP